MEYTWSKYENEEIYRNGTFESVEECIAEAKECEISAGTTIYIGECEAVEIGGVDLSGVLERVEEDMYEQVGEVSEGWDISSIKERQGIYEIYEERLKNLVCDYIKEIGEEPSFYHVTNVRPIVVN